MTCRELAYRVLMLVALSMTVLVVAACGYLWPDDEIDCADNRYGLTIVPPTSAEILEERCRSAFNPDYRLVLTMAASDLEAFQAATPVTDWGTDTSRLLTFKREAARATSLLTGFYSNGVILVEALIDTSNPGRYTVYYQATFVD